MKLYSAVRDTPVSFAMAVLETPSSRKCRISSSRPSRRETPSEPFGRPSFRPAAQVLLRHRNPEVGDGLHGPLAHETRIPVLYLTDAAHGTRHVPCR